MRAVLAAVLASAFLLPATVGAEEPVTAHDEGVRECRGHMRDEFPTPWPCWFYARANWTVESCDATTCTVRVDTQANAGAVMPGIMDLRTFVHAAGQGGACLGTQEIADILEEELGWPCSMTCKTYTVAWTAKCHGEKTNTVEVEPGTCVMYWVFQVFSYDAYVPVVWSSEFLLSQTFLCRADDGTPRFVVWASG